MKNNLLSIVIPMFNEEGNIKPLYQELLSVLSSLKHFKTFEIIAVNDGSSDNTLTILKQLAAKDSRIKVISFMRNFGHEQATYAGIHNATGEAVVLIDADRQDPPELILEFEKEYLNGYHIVYGQRSKRLNESWFKKFTSKCFYPIFKKLTGIDMPRNVGDFCLMSRKTVDCFKQLPERTLFVRGMIYWTGLPKKAVQFIRRSRGAGTSKYNYSKLTIFALENIISFSTVPIYTIMFLSLGTIALCGAGIFIALFMRLLGRVVLTGWTSLIISMLFLSASTLFCLSLLGLYIGKIFQEIKQRPIFLIDEKINFEESSDFAIFSQHKAKQPQQTI
jgi:polyisoprenyl-phosphate glycosyltransferase